MPDRSPRLRAALAFAAAALGYTLVFAAFVAVRMVLAEATGERFNEMWSHFALIAGVSVSVAALVGAAAGPWFAARVGRRGAGALGGAAVTVAAYALACVGILLFSLRPGGFFGAWTAFGPGLVDIGPERVIWAARTFGLLYVLLPALPLGVLAGAVLVRTRHSAP